MAQNRMWNGQTEGWTTRQLYAKANTKGWHHWHQNCGHFTINDNHKNELYSS